MYNKSNGPNVNGSSASNDPLDNLYPALVECFGIIILGYITGRLGIITSTEGKGLSKFAINAALPAYIFRAIATLDFSEITWKFVFVVTLAKALLFVAVVALTLLFSRNIGKAGIYGLFCVVSNDLAMGIPVLKAMYEVSHKEFIYCLYFLVLVSLVIFTPIGIMMMEFRKQQSKPSSKGVGYTMLRTLKSTITNPVVISSIVGIPCNFIFHQDLPAALDKLFETLSLGFPAAALFYLGLSVVGKIKTQFGTAILVPLSLVAAKILILPLMIRGLVKLFEVGGSDKLNEDWSVFGFIYGTIPAAPAVVIYASAFGIQEDMLASAMVMSTFFTAPVMFISSKMSSVNEMNSTQVKYRDILSNTRNDISFVAIAVVVSIGIFMSHVVIGCWIVLILFLSRRYKVPPHNYTICLAVSQMLLCISFVLTKSESFIKKCKLLECFLITTFLLSTHCWTAMLAFALARIRCSATEDTLLRKIGMYFFGWGFPVLCSGLVLILLDFDEYSSEQMDLFIYIQEKHTYSGICFAVRVVCVVISVSSLVYLHRCDTYCKCTMVKRRKRVDEGNPLLQSEECYRCNKSAYPSSIRNAKSTVDNGVNVTDIEQSEQTPLLTTSLEEKPDSVKQYGMKDNLKLERYYEGEQHQSGRHVIVIMCLNLLMIICIFFDLWILFGDEAKSGIFLEVQLLVTIVLSSQILIVFAVFGFERALIIDPFLQKLRHFWYGVDEVTLPRFDDLPPDEYHICEQFARHHKANCVRALTEQESSVQTSSGVNSVSYSFLGSELVDWLLQVGLVSDRVTAVHYGNSLLRGRVIRHIENKYYFTDTELVYEFCIGWECSDNREITV